MGAGGRGGACPALAWRHGDRKQWQTCRENRECSASASCAVPCPSLVTLDPLAK